MNPSSPPPTAHPPHEVTELAKERNRQASERTLTSWINQSLWLVGLGVITAEVTPPGQSPVAATAGLQPWSLPALLSLGTIASGILLLIPITIAHWQSLRALAQPDYLTRSGQSWHVLIAVVIGVGLWAIVYLCLLR